MSVRGGVVCLLQSTCWPNKLGTSLYRLDYKRSKSRAVQGSATRIHRGTGTETRQVKSKCNAIAVLSYIYTPNRISLSVTPCPGVRESSAVISQVLQNRMGLLYMKEVVYTLANVPRARNMSSSLF